MARNDRLAGLDEHHTPNPVIAYVLSSIPTRDNFIFAETFLYKNVTFMFQPKTSNVKSSTAA